MKVNTGLILREIYGKFILMPIRCNEASNDPICLNDVAANIWMNASMAANRYELQKLICDMYELNLDSVESYSIENFINQLIEKKLLFE